MVSDTELEKRIENQTAILERLESRQERMNIALTGSMDGTQIGLLQRVAANESRLRIVETQLNTLGQRLWGVIAMVIAAIVTGLAKAWGAAH